MEREEVFAFVEECNNGEPATCIVACPFHLDIKSFLKKVSKGRLGAALQELNKTLPFPVMISEICPAPCEQQCQRKTVMQEETISIRALEQASVHAKEKKERKSYQLPPLKERAAIIGAGPTGLACALYLSRKRYPVVVYDRNLSWGGSLSNHPKMSVFEAEIMKKFEAADVDFRFGETITDLSQVEGYDVVFVATGADGEDFGLLEGCNQELGSTQQPKIFLGGELLGMNPVEGMAHAGIVAKAMESYLQTGNPEHAMLQWEKTDCAKNVPHHGDTPTEHIVPAGEYYSTEEAQAEASRCMQCDCEECVAGCELLTKYKKKPPRIAIDVAQDGMTRNSVSSACITRQTWSCNQCGHCTDICQENVNVGGMFELSRKDRVESGNYPPAFHGYWMSEMEWAVSESSLSRPAAGMERCEYVFFPGCRLGGANPQYVLKSYEALLKQNPKTGIMLNCCGIPALWAGEGKRFQEHIEELREMWHVLGEPAVVYACASCRRTFERFMPEIPVISLYELLENTAEASCEKDGVYAVFDPCSASGMKEVRQSVRNMADALGCQISDYDSNGKCCGFGGHIQLANPEFYDEVAQTRCQETEDPYLVYCVNCMEVFRAHGKESRHILDLLFALETSGVTTLEEKRQNNLLVKQSLLKTYWQEEYEPVHEPWEDLQLEIPAEVQSRMERLMIPAHDIQKNIWENEQASEGFENENGEIICRMVNEYLTSWVKYKKTGDQYQLLAVYSHRMHIREDQI